MLGGASNNQQQLNLKDNMKASFGVVYQEGSNHIDRGPSYIQKIQNE